MTRAKAKWLDVTHTESTRTGILVRFMRTRVLADAALAARAQALLSPAERMTCAGLRPAAARRDWLGAHVLARLALADVAGIEPDRLILATTALGLPHVVAPPVATCYGVSIAHADGVALCGVAESFDLGVDVASVREIGSEPLAAAEAVCSRRELAQLRALPAGTRPGRFLTLWTRKEALARARGVGFGCVAGALVSDAGAAWRAPAAPGEEDDLDPSDGRVETLRLTAYHFAAVAILGAPRIAIGIRLEEVAPEVGASVRRD
jgi:4'-phosphopantetheinyl transferase